MTDRRHNFLLILAIGSSVALHLLALAPMFMVEGLARVQTVTVVFQPRVPEPRRPDPPDPPEPAEEEEPPITLGIEAETPPSKTWVGYDEYVRHLAPLSEMEQAAFDDDPAGMSGEGGSAAAAGAPGPSIAAPPEASAQVPTPAEPVPPPVEPTKAAAPNHQEIPDAAEAAEAVDIELPPEAAAQAKPPSTQPKPSQPATPRSAPVSEEALSEFSRWLESTQGELGPTEPPRVPEVSDPVEQLLQELERVESEAREAEAAEAEEEAAAASRPEVPPDPEGSKPAEPKEATPNAKPPEHSGASGSPGSPGAPGSPGEGRGDQSDRESDPTSIIEVSRDQWQLGKPLAAHGLEIRPVRPSPTILQTLTISAGNPLCELRFGGDGKVKLVRFVHGSGSERFDDLIRSSLYRWRATGKELAKLGESETIDIQIRLIFSRLRG